MPENPITDRKHLRFAEEVKICFTFLEALGFRCVHSEATLVQFKSAELVIDIYHERQSYEIGLGVKSARESFSYSLSEVLRLINNKKADEYRDYATHTVQGVAEGVHQLADIFRECIDTGIFSDSKLFNRLKMQRKILSTSCALETQLNLARKKSELAWTQKDFEKVVQILSPLQQLLSPTEIKKLEYAKKQMGLS